MLLTHGAARVLRAASRRAAHRADSSMACDAGRWSVQGRSNHNKATCALANKLARICYATLRDKRDSTATSRLTKKIDRSRLCDAGLNASTRQFPTRALRRD